jgi:hypothetical protein
VQHTVTATITFPKPGEKPLVFDARAEKHKSLFGLVAVLLLLLVLMAMGAHLWRRRQRDTTSA